MLHWYANFQSAYLALDTMNPPLDNIKLRQALAHAIDRDTLSYTRADRACIARLLHAAARLPRLERATS